MAEHINRNELIAHLKKDPLFELVERYGITGVIQSIPAADVVEVVRCKDCINHRQSGLCEGWSRYGTINTPDDAFCSYGVKIDG